MHAPDLWSVQEILQRHNPYRWNREEPLASVTYRVEAEDLCEAIERMAYGPADLFAGLANLLGAILYTYGQQPWAMGDYRDIAKEVYALMCRTAAPAAA